MFRLPKTISDLHQDAALLRHARYGVIEMLAGRLVGIHLRRWPRIVSLWDVEWLGPRFHACRQGDRCWLYYKQPWRYPNFMALSYVVSSRDCQLVTFQGALQILDEIARIKRADALLCDAWNRRITDRLLARWGWEPHTQSRWHRNYIKRFYGIYPAKRRANPTPQTQRVPAVNCPCPL